ncbi:alpha/beta hydrolase-fold protein [Bosea sp. UNC402CLCol]|uniref:alpha/beta hydrolase n=1 Tax=Bosea sp. UNC402CLCol TaxID=1510531 RepID=UPI00056E7A55|nr:alpha/beta hydrolase-fold protein [Bosea sp. UNC402CLCol]
MTMDAILPVPETVRFDLTPQAGGAPYRIFLRIPPGTPPASGWPVLYLLDANAVIATAVEALRVQAAYPLGTGIRDAVVVGIGYPTEGAYDSVRRSWDYGPPPGQVYPPHAVGGPDVRTGGAEAFLTFIEEELKPLVATRTRIDAAHQAIFGHSFGGLFVLYALFTRPAAFRDWIAISPAIWWEQHNVLRFAAAPEGAVRVFLGVGEYEQALAPFQIGAPDESERRGRLEEARTVDETREMAERLRGYGKPVEFAVFEGETHMSVLPVAINRAIRFAFGP